MTYERRSYRGTLAVPLFVPLPVFNISSATMHF